MSKRVKSTKVVGEPEPVVVVVEKKSKKVEEAPVEEKKTKKTKKSDESVVVGVVNPVVEEKKTKKDKKVEEAKVEKVEEKKADKKPTDEPAVPKKTKHKPRDDSLDFDVKPNDPSWMTVDIKRLTRTRTMNFLSRWIEDSIADSNRTKTPFAMIPFPHEHFQLDAIRVQPPNGLDNQEKAEYPVVLNKLKWAEVIRFMQMWVNNPRRIPLAITSPTSDPQSPDAIFMFTHAQIKIANTEFLKVCAQKKQRQAKKAKEAYEDKVRNLKKEHKWELKQTPRVQLQKKTRASDGEEIKKVEEESEPAVVETTVGNEDEAPKKGKKEKKEKKDNKDNKDNKVEDKIDEPVVEIEKPKKRKVVEVEVEEPVKVKKAKRSKD